jgi:hypothetical protein
LRSTATDSKALGRCDREGVFAVVVTGNVHEDARLARLEHLERGAFVDPVEVRVDVAVERRDLLVEPVAGPGARFEVRRAGVVVDGGDLVIARRGEVAEEGRAPRRGSPS